ncbi:MAG: type II secretion system protein N [Sterolibacterium sp.]|nr:type II secretion system protein N [Sterolibacterium sp.]
MPAYTRSPRSPRSPSTTAPRTSRIRLLYTAFFLLCLLIAGLSQWPAAWLGTLLEHGANGAPSWQLTATQGSVWQGQGMLLLKDPVSNEWQNFQQLRWQVQGRPLWSGHLVIDLTLEQDQLRLDLSPAGLDLTSFDVTLPARGVASLLPGPPGRYGWNGLLQATGTRFGCRWNRNDCHGSAELRWSDAAVTEINSQPLGNYRMLLTGEGPALRLDLTTLDGRLTLTGHGESRHDGQLDFRIEADTRNSPDESLNRMLASLGRALGEGKYLLEYRSPGRRE